MASITDNEPQLQITDDEIDQRLDICQKYAESMGWQVNPNRKVARSIIKMTLKNQKEKGVLYCPCKPNQFGEMVGDRYRSACPCVDAGDEIAAKGHCCCNLYVK